MAMGSTGTVNMTAKMMSDVIQAVEEHQTLRHSLTVKLQVLYRVILKELQQTGLKPFMKKHL